MTGEELEGGVANPAGQTALLGCEAPSSPVTTYLVTMTTDREAGRAGWQPWGERVEAMGMGWHAGVPCG